MTGIAMIPFFLTIAGALSAGMYALARVAVLDGVSLLGLLYWQAVSSAVIVSVAGALFGMRPRFSLRRIPEYAVAVVLGASPLLIASQGPTKVIATWVLIVAFVVLLIAGSGGEDAPGAEPRSSSPLGAAGGMLIVQALALDPVAAHAHALVLPGSTFTRLDGV